MAKLATIAPHTVAKHLLLKRYLDAWFPILGRYNDRINYIDGFAGPGEYEGGEEGSPLLAIEAARSHVDRGTLSANVNIRFFFIEADHESAKHLDDKLSRITIPPQFKVKVIEREFASAIGEVLDHLQSTGKLLAPTFAFVDPFGFSGIPLSLMAQILRYPKCEVFVNIMVDFINRFLEHPNDSVVAHVPQTFGTDEVLGIPAQAGDRVAALLNLYRRQLKSQAKFIGRFDMHGSRDRKTYSLYFGSNAPKGFEKMKEAMWSVDKAQGGKFSDADPMGRYTFDLFGVEPLWEDMASHFDGRQVPMVDVERFVIEQTDYLPKHARTLLKEREDRGEIVVVPVAGYKRRKGSFCSDKVSIVFRQP
jgi:three-Cys-motif partner protein